MKHISEVLAEMGWPLTLKALARRVRANVPSHRDPEKFHVEQDAIASALEELAKVKNHGG